jgi:hypothetical protein
MISRSASASIAPEDHDEQPQHQAFQFLHVVSDASPNHFFLLVGIVPPPTLASAAEYFICCTGSIEVLLIASALLIATSS